MKKLLKILLAFSLMIASIILGNSIKDGIIDGIYLCGYAVIPSLYLSTVFSIYLSNNLLVYVKPKLKVLCILFLSSIGGFPTGAKIIADGVSNKTIDINTARKIFPLCLGAGPGFIVVYIGSTLLGSYKTGTFLLLSNLLSTLYLGVIYSLFSNKAKILKPPAEYKEYSLSQAVTDGAKAIITVCSWVIIFSGLQSIILKFDYGKIGCYIISLCEITNGLRSTHNIYVIAFILSFGGFCVHAQVFSLAHTIKPNYFKFLSLRLLHGAISVLNLKLCVKIFKLSESTGNFYSITPFSSGLFVSVCQILCVVILIYTFLEKNIEKFV